MRRLKMASLASCAITMAYATTSFAGNPPHTRARVTAQPASVIIPTAPIAPSVPQTPAPEAAPSPPASSAPIDENAAKLTAKEMADIASFHLKNPNEMVSFSLEDVDLDELVRAIGDVTGKRFVFASSKLKAFKATIFSPQKVTIAEAYQAFLALLQSSGLTVIAERDFLKIVDAQDVQHDMTQILKDGEIPPPEERYVTEMHRVMHVSADDAAALLSKFQTKDGSIVPFAPDNLLIMTDTGTNLRRMKRILDEVDVGGDDDKIWLEPLHYAASSDMQKKLSELLDLKDANSNSKGATSGNLRVTKIVAIDRPNSLAIVATEGAYAKTLEIIKRLDVPFGGDGEMHVVQLQHSEAKKLVASLNEALGSTGGSAGSGSNRAAPNAGASGNANSVLEGAVRLSAEETTNSILITASPRDFASIRNVIAQLDIPRRQVFIEAVVMDLSVDSTTALGVSFHGLNAGTSGTIAGGLNPAQSILSAKALSSGDLQGLALNVTGPEIALPSALASAVGISSIPAFGALISAMTTAAKTDIISTPNILATDNTPAELHVQLNTPSQKNVPSLAAASTALAGTGALGLGGLGTTTPSMLQIGPKIKITPHLTDSDEVRLDVDETISDVQDVPGGTLGTVSFLERGAKTTLTVRDQQTVVIGGLIRDYASRNETKIPLLGDIPLLGVLFRSTSNQTTKSNLVLVLTPYIIREQDDLRRIFERKSRERQMLIDRDYLFGAQHYEPPKDHGREHGLLAAIKKTGREIEAQEQLAAMRAPRAVIHHDAQEPLEMPTAPMRTWGAAKSAQQGPVKPTATTASVDRVEK
jgi:general secretion pathway protein D